MTHTCAVCSRAPGAASPQAAPPRYDSISHGHRVQHYDSPAWQDLRSNVCFVFFPPPGLGAAEGERQWEARLRVKARDLPRLMREGFHWSAANVDSEAGYFRLDLDGDVENLADWTCSRTYFLSDLGDDPHWTARMVVYALSIAVLSRFTVADVTMGNMAWAAAWRTAERGRNDLWVYGWNCDEPEESFNAIYDDMPLAGWWPWPKVVVDVDDANDETTTTTMTTRPR